MFARALLLCCLVVVLLTLTGCGGGGHHHSGQNPLSVSTATLPNGTVGSAYSATLSATGGVSPYSWTLASSSQLPTGLTLSSSGQISGTPTASGTTSFTVTVTDSASPAASANGGLSITVNPATLSVTTTGLPGGTLGSAYSASVAATGGVPPYSWSWTAASGSQLPPGLALSSSGQITGTPTTSGTYSFTVTVNDSAAPANTASAGLSVVVAATSACAIMGSESLLSGQYAFLLTGFDNGQGTGEAQPEPALVGGVLTFNGSGTITGGVIDMNLNSGPQTNLALTSGSYGIGSDQRGCMAVTTSASTQNYRFAVGNITSGVAATAHVVVFDGGGPYVVGTMLQQSSSAFGTGTGQIRGAYAFGVSSAQNSAIGGKFGAVGALFFDGLYGTINGNEMDMNLNGQLDGSSANTTWPSTAVLINSGDPYTVNSTTGRGTFSFTPDGFNAMDGILYVVSSNEMLVLCSDPQTTANIWAGKIMTQVYQPTLSGMYVAYDSGLGTSSGRTDIVLLGPFASGGTSFPFTQLRNDSGTFTSQTVSGTSASYSVDTNGRVTVTTSGANHLPVVYLSGTSVLAGFSLNSNGGVDSGEILPQISTSAPSGIYALGNVDPQISGSTLKSGVADFSSSTISLTLDENSSGSLSLGNTQGPTAVSVDATGLGYIPSGCTISASSTTCDTLFYIISPTKAVVLDATSATPKLTILDQ